MGSHIVEELLIHGAKVRVPIHKRPLPISDGRVEVFRSNLMKEQDCFAAVEGVDYVFHAAGFAGSAAVKVNKAMAAITSNLILTGLMLQAAWAGGVKRFLLFGSSTGYPAADYPIKEEEMWEAPPFEGYFGYGWMRPTAVYGRRDNFDPGSSHVIPALIQRAATKENPFEVWGSGDVVRDFLHISDLARGCLLMLEKHAECDPVNIGYGRGCTIKETVNLVLEAAGHENAKVVFDTSKPTAIPIRLVDISKARKVLGFEPKIALKDGIRDTVDWFANTHRKFDK